MKLPFFSIIIPTYNRARFLINCLKALTRLDYPSDNFEVILVDDGSEESLEPIVAPYFDWLNLSLLSQCNAGPATARNIGAAHSKGEYLAFTDDDCMPKADWLYRLAIRFNQTPNHAVGGQTVNALIENPYAIASQSLINYLYSYFNSEGSKHNLFFTSNNLALPKEGFKAIGGFDTNFPLAAGEDRELCDRWQYHGYQMVYAPEALVYHTHTLTLYSYWKQHFNYGRGAYFFHKARAQRYQARIEPEPGVFYRDLILYPFNQMTRRRAMLTMALLIKSQIANAVGFGWELLSAFCDPTAKTKHIRLKQIPARKSNFTTNTLNSETNRDPVNHC